MNRFHAEAEPVVGPVERLIETWRLNYIARKRGDLELERAVAAWRAFGCDQTPALA